MDLAGEVVVLLVVVILGPLVLVKGMELMGLVGAWYRAWGKGGGWWMKWGGILVTVFTWLRKIDGEGGY